LHRACWMSEQRPQPVQPSQLHRENGAVKFQRKHRKQIGGSASVNPPTRTTERDAKNVGAWSSTASNVAGAAASGSGSTTRLPRP
jgi:hypothetical protein